jgi:hypothetical protein
LGFSKSYSGTIAVDLIYFLGLKIELRIYAFSMVDILISRASSADLTID